MSNDYEVEDYDAEIYDSAAPRQILSPFRNHSRLDIVSYAMALAHVASLRSEDPYRQVGACALDHNNRVIGTGYNGLAPGFNPPKGFWDDRDARQKYMLHAEINLMSLFTRGEAKIVAVTTMPCTYCMQAMCSHDVKEIYYAEEYPGSDSPHIAKTYGVKFKQVKIPNL